MNIRTGFVLIALIGVLSASEVPAQPRAGHSDYLTGLTQQALKQPFRSKTLPVLEVAEGPGREQTARALLALVSADPARPRTGVAAPGLAPVTLAKQVDDDKVLTYAGDRGYLEVIADGSAFRFRADSMPRNGPNGNSPADDKRELETGPVRAVTGQFLRSAEAKHDGLGVR